MLSLLLQRFITSRSSKKQRSDIRQKIYIDDHTTIGIGASVFHDINKQANMIGYPARKYLVDSSLVAIKDSNLPSNPKNKSLK